MMKKIALIGASPTFAQKLKGMDDSVFEIVPMPDLQVFVPPMTRRQRRKLNRKKK